MAASEFNLLYLQEIIEIRLTLFIDCLRDSAVLSLVHVEEALVNAASRLFS